MGFCLYLAFVQVYANCLTLTNSYGDYITDCCRNFFYTEMHTLCSSYNKSHWISAKRNLLMFLCLKSSNVNVYPHFHVFPFLLHYSMASCCFEILGWEKKTPLMLHCKTSKQSAAVIDLEVIRHWIVDPDISFYSVKYCCCSAVWLHR